jgi:hypothetical protein
VGYRLDVRNSIPARRNNFLLSPQCLNRLQGSSNLLSNGHQGIFPREVKRSWREAGHSPQYCAGVQNGAYIFMTSCLMNYAKRQLGHLAIATTARTCNPTTTFLDQSFSFNPEDGSRLWARHELSAAADCTAHVYLRVASDQALQLAQHELDCNNLATSRGCVQTGDFQGQISNRHCLAVRLCCKTNCAYCREIYEAVCNSET